MSSKSPQPNPPRYRTLVVIISLLSVIALAEAGLLAWFVLSPAKRDASSPKAQAVSPTPAVRNMEQDVVAAAIEKSLVSTLPQPTPVPSAPTLAPAVPVRNTPEARVAGLTDLARQLRDRGDTGTAMTRLREAQAIFSRYPPIISEMALTYEKMGLKEKAIEQWRRIYEIGEPAGIYYAAAEAKLRALQLPDASTEEKTGADQPISTGLTPDQTTGPVLTLGQVGTTDDTGNTQPQRKLTLRVPIKARQGVKIDPRDVVIQVFFYELLNDVTVVETNANVTSSWSRRTSNTGDVLPVDWSTPDPEVLEVNYAQSEFDPKDPRTRERRKYFGYSVRVYYKGVLEAKFADPEKLLGQFIPPAAIPSSDLPQ